jgi:ribosome-binding factor A
MEQRNERDMEHRNDKAREVVRAAIASFIETESNRQSMITVTNVHASPDFKRIDIFVTVFPEHTETAAIDFLKRQRREAREYLKKHTRLARIPFLDFALDQGEKARQRIDDISREI